MKVRFLRTTAVMLILAVVLIVVYRWRQASGPFAGEPVYHHKPLHQWAIDTVNQDLAWESDPSAAVETARAVQAIGPAAVPWLVKWIKPAPDQGHPPIVLHVNPLLGRVAVIWIKFFSSRTERLPDTKLSQGAMNCFKILGSRANAAVPDLNAILNMPGDSFRIKMAKMEAAAALEYVSKTAPPLICADTNPALEDLRQAFLNGLGNCSNCPEAIPTLIQWSHDPDEAMRFAALMALSHETGQPDLVVPVLCEALKETNNAIRNPVADALGDFGKSASNSVPELIKLLDDPKTAGHAIYSLGKIGEPADVIFPLLVKKLHDLDWRVRHISADALGEFGGQRAFDALMQMTDDRETRVRRAVFQSLNKIDPEQLKKSGKHF